MKRIDLDDLPPRIAHILAGLEDEEALMVVRNGVVVRRLAVVATARPADPPADLPPEEPMAEVLEHFNAMIHDEF